MGDSPDQLIRHGICVLFPEKTVVELRAIDLGGGDGRYKRTANGYFNDHDLLAHWALSLENQQPSGIYYTLNPLDPACIHRYPPNKTRESASATTDKDILGRYWLPIDIDPIRTSRVSSTDEELEIARERAEKVSEWLKTQGFPDPVVGFSGNGYHLLYRIDEPVDSPLIKSSLEVLSDKFSDEEKPGCKIDTVVHNPARIWKAYGTVSRKGNNSDERPHRRSRLVQAPDNFASVPLTQSALLTELSKIGDESSGGGRQAASRTPKLNSEYAIDLEEFLTKHGIRFGEKIPWDTTGYKYYLDACLFDSSHVGTSSCIGRTPDGKIFYKCQHNSCEGNKWKQVWEKFEGSGKKAKSAKKNSKKKAADKDEIHPEDIAAMFIQQKFTDEITGDILIRSVGTDVYLWQKNRYSKSMKKDELAIEVRNWLYNEQIIRGVKDHVVSSIVNNVISQCIHPTIDNALPSYAILRKGDTRGVLMPEPRHWINLNDGIFDFGKFIAGTPPDSCFSVTDPHWLSTAATRFDYPSTQEARQCPEWTKYLNQTFYDGTGPDQGMIDLLQEMFGYSFFLDQRYQVFFVLYGRAATGKSVAIDVLKAMVGKDYSSAVSLSDLNSYDKKYSIAHLEEKLINIDSDASEKVVNHEVIKKLSDGSSIEARHPYGRVMKLTPYAKQIISCNRFPRIVDTTGGTWRRLVVLPFDNWIAPANRDEMLGARISQNELAGVFWWSLEGARRLVARRRFELPQKSLDAYRRYRTQSLPLVAFLEDCTEPAEISVPGSIVYEFYRWWCERNGLGKPKTLLSFMYDMKDILEAESSQQWVDISEDQTLNEQRFMFHNLGITQQALDAKQGLYFNRMN